MTLAIRSMMSTPWVLKLQMIILSTPLISYTEGHNIKHDLLQRVTYNDKQ